MRVVRLAALAAAFTALAPAAGWAAGGTLTVPAQVAAQPGAAPVLDATFSYPDPSPICTTGVTFTWDGDEWLSQLPVSTGAACVASAPGAAAPGDRSGAGLHTVCGTAGPGFRDCKTVTIVAPAAAPPAATPA